MEENYDLRKKNKKKQEKNGKKKRGKTSKSRLHSTWKKRMESSNFFLEPLETN